MSSINSLLNHEPASKPRQSSSSSSHDDHHHHVAKTTTFEAADALTTLASLSSGQQYAPAAGRELPSPTAFAHAPRRTSSFGSRATPVEPSPPIDEPQVHSPTLDHYHHGSKSPEEQRRQSLIKRTSSPAPVLAPMIQSLSGVLNDRIPSETPHISQSHGKDVSQMVPPPSRSSDEGGSGRDQTQNREPAFVRNEPTTSQIREPESADTAPHPISTNVSASQGSEAQLPSPMPYIKNEPSGTPREGTPSTTVAQSSERRGSIIMENVDSETRKTIESIKQNDLGLRTKRTASVTESVTSPTEPKPAPTISKKRPASSTTAVKKKGTAATKKPAPKKRKLDTHERSATPTSRTSKQRLDKGGKKGSQAGTPVAESSPAPDNSSQMHPSDEDADSSDDNSLYCICRKPDNHKWMIGCDGGCDDWFHGSCVDMLQADEDLVDKFICPNCEAAGRHQTTWKPMCRRDGCRKPARLTKNKESKYCSDECGVQFFEGQLQRTAGAKKPNSRRSKKKGGKDGEEHEHGSDEEEEPTPLGGVLRAKDLKALAVSSKDIEAFKRLGSGVLSPPQTASPTRDRFDGMPNGSPNPNDGLPLTGSELAHLNALHIEKTDLRNKLEMLKDREKFVSMAREQATRYAEKEKMKVKEFCGYDSRLSWSDAEFMLWRNSKVGKAAFQHNTLSPTAEQIASVDEDGDTKMTNGVKTNGEEKENDKDLCIKKRCPKHPQWQKLNLQDARFEELEIVEAIRECEKEERSVRERAKRRGAKDAVAAELVGAGGIGKREERNRDGWVEAVEVS